MSRKRLNRRTFVTAAGTASAIALAGCADSGPGGNESAEENDTTGEEESGAGNESEAGGEDETYALTVTVEDDQGPVEGATVTLEEAGLGGGGMGNESENESDNESTGDIGASNESENESDNETMADDELGSGNESENESDNETASGIGNESDNETASGVGNESDNESASGVGGQEFPMEEETDENGEVEFDGLEDGEYTVTAENEGQQAEEDVEIDGGDEEVTLMLGEGGAGGNETSSNETGGNETNESDV